MLRRIQIVLLTTLYGCLALLGCAQDKQWDRELQGSIVGENVYKNSALGMSITLPGNWQMLPQRTTQMQPSPDCRGPLCGEPEIEVTIKTKSDSNVEYYVFLSAYKLSPEYLDRTRNPLRRFAEVMMAGSLGGSGLVALGEQTPIQLDGKPAFRLLVAKQGEKLATRFGYVADANGYVFLLIGTAPEKPMVLQSAIEAMKLTTTKH